MFFRLNLPQKGWAKRPPPKLPRPTGQSFPGEVAVRKHGLVHWLPIPAWLRKTPTVWPAVTFEHSVLVPLHWEESEQFRQLLPTVVACTT